MSERQLNEEQFRGNNLKERIKKLRESNPEYDAHFSDVEKTAKSKQQDLRREILFEKIRSLQEYKTLKSEYEKLSRGQKERVQSALGFTGTLVDGIFGERMFLALKSLPEDKKKYSLLQLSYTDENGGNLELYNKIVDQLQLKSPEKIKEIQSKLKGIDADGVLGPKSFAALQSYLTKQKIQITGTSTQSPEPTKKELEVRQPSPEFVAPEVVPLPKPREPRRVDIEKPVSSTVTAEAPIDFSAEEVTHRAQRDRLPSVSPAPQVVPRVQPTTIETKPQSAVQTPQVVDIPRPPRDIPSERISFDNKEFLSDLKQNLGVLDGEVLKKKGENFVVLSKEGKEKKVITENEGEVFLLAQYYFNLINGGVYKSQASFDKAIKGQKATFAKLKEDLGLRKEATSKEVFETYRNSPYGKLLTLEDYLGLKSVEDDFVKAFPNYGLENGDSFVVDDDIGTITIFRKKSGKVEVKSTQGFGGLENNLNKYTQFKKDFSKIKGDATIQSRLSKILGVDITNELEFRAFFSLIVEKDFFKYAQGIQDLLNIKSFDGVNYKDIVSKYKKYGITEKLITVLGIQSGDLLLFDEEEKTLNIFRVKDGMRKEQLSLENLLEQAFSNNLMDSVISILSSGNNGERLKNSFKELLRSDRAKARERFLFPMNILNTSAQRINFYNSKVLEKIITAFDLFGDKPFIKEVDPKNPKDVVIYKNTGSDFYEFRTREEKLRSGDFISNLGERISAVQDTYVIDIISQEEINSYNEGVSVQDLFEHYKKIKNERKKEEFALFINKTIIESRKFQETKALFVKAFGIPETQFEPLVSDTTLRKNISAYAVFALDGISYITATDMKGNVKTYKRNDAIGQYISESGEKLTLDVKFFTTQVQEKDKFLTITDFIQPNKIDVNGLREYLKNIEGDQAKEKQVMEYFRGIIKKSKLQRFIREAFSTQNADRVFIIDFKGCKSCEKYLTAFDFFGDQDYLGAVEDNGQIKREYRKESRGEDSLFVLLGSAEGERLKLSQGFTLKVLKREDIDFSKYKLESNFYLRKIGRPVFMRNPETGVTLCARTARDFAMKNLKSTSTPGGAAYAFQQFHFMQMKSENGLSLGEGTQSSTEIPSRVLGLDEVNKFLERIRARGIFAAQIYMDASGDYYDKRGNKAYYGHVATVVLDRETDKYFVLDAYHKGGQPTELSKYYEERTSQISRGTAKNKKIRGIAALS